MVHPEYNPYAHLEGRTARLGFPSREAETGDPQSKLTSKTIHQQDPCLENKEEVLLRRFMTSSLVYTCKHTCPCTPVSARMLANNAHHAYINMTKGKDKIDLLRIDGPLSATRTLYLL